MATSDESGGERIQVVVDAEIEDLIPGFLENRAKDVQLIASSLETDDFHSIRVCGHSMKGSGGGYGFDRISAIGREIEEAAKVRDADAIRAATAALDDYLKRVDITYE